MVDPGSAAGEATSSPGSGAGRARAGGQTRTGSMPRGRQSRLQVVRGLCCRYLIRARERGARDRERRRAAERGAASRPIVASLRRRSGRHHSSSEALAILTTRSCDADVRHYCFFLSASANAATEPPLSRYPASQPCTAEGGPDLQTSAKHLPSPSAPPLGKATSSAMCTAPKPSSRRVPTSARASASAGS